MSGIISTSSFAAAVAPQNPKWFGTGYERYGSIVSDLMEEQSMAQAVERDVLIVCGGLMQATSEGESTT